MPANDALQRFSFIPERSFRPKPELKWELTDITCEICKGKFPRPEMAADTRTIHCKSCFMLIDYLMQLFNWNNRELATEFLRLVRNYPTVISVNNEPFNPGVSITLGQP